MLCAYKRFCWMRKRKSGVDDRIPGRVRTSPQEHSAIPEMDILEEQQGRAALTGDYRFPKIFELLYRLERRPRNGPMRYLVEGDEARAVLSCRGGRRLRCVVYLRCPQDVGLPEKIGEVSQTVPRMKGFRCCGGCMCLDAMGVFFRSPSPQAMHRPILLVLLQEIAAGINLWLHES